MFDVEITQILDTASPPEIDVASLSGEEAALMVKAADKVIAAWSVFRLKMVGRVDQTREFEATGARDVAAWLAKTSQISLRDARDEAKTAEVLEDLPLIEGAIQSGEISLSVGKELAGFASPGEDEALSKAAPGWSVEQARRFRRMKNRVSLEEESEVFEKRNFSYHWNENKTALSFRGVLPAPQGAMLQTGVDALFKRQKRSDAFGEYVTYDQRMADAFSELVSLGLGSESLSNFEAVVHIDHQTLTGRDGDAEVGEGLITGELARSISCSSSIRALIETGDGIEVLGSKSRTPPKKLAEYVTRRDRSCRFIGCENAICQIHHIIPVSKGGPTTPANLGLFCWFHHNVAIHRQRWKVIGNAEEDLVAISPGGKRFVLPKRVKGIPVTGGVRLDLAPATG